MTQAREKFPALAGEVDRGDDEEHGDRPCRQCTNEDTVRKRLGPISTREMQPLRTEQGADHDAEPVRPRDLVTGVPKPEGSRPRSYQSGRIGQPQAAEKQGLVIAGKAEVIERSSGFSGIADFGIDGTQATLRPARLANRRKQT